LLDRERLSDRQKRIHRDSKAEWPQRSDAPGGTAYLCVVDSAGLGVSLIQSNFTGLGSEIGAGDAGFLLHNRGAGFNLREGHPNELKPGRRPLHTLSPTLWTHNGELRLLLGTRGGYHQPQLLIQVIAQLFRLGEEPAGAQAAPRWIIDTDDDLHLEATMPGAVIDGLRTRGHSVSVEEAHQSRWGPVSMISLSDNGLRTAAADPRVDTALAVLN
ncbi:MAG: gamma-glutamyltransferase, partial [Acidimicrobiia bacterium]